MTKTFKQYLENLHLELWKKSDEKNKISTEQVKNTIKMTCGSTVVDKFYNALFDFDRVEQIPHTQSVMVKKPETSEIKGGEDVKRIRVDVNKDLIESAKDMGVDVNSVVSEALLEEVGRKKEFVKRTLSEDLNSQEIEYVFKLLKESLHQNAGSKKDMSKRGRRRRDLYREVFDDTIGSEQTQHIEELRKHAFKIHEKLNT